MQENLNLFDLLLHETYPWEALQDEHKILAIGILARLIANASQPNHGQGNDHE